jgi:hypothetical protein
MTTPTIPADIMALLQAGGKLKREAKPGTRGRSRWQRKLDTDEFQARQRMANVILGWAYTRMREEAPEAFAAERRKSPGMITSFLAAARERIARGWEYPAPIVPYGPDLDGVGSGYDVVA